MLPMDFSRTHGNCIHFPDLAEIRSGTLAENANLASIPTEFVFCTTGTFVNSNQVETILSLGFKEVGAMKNWHWIHHNEWTKPIRLFWKRIHSVKDAKPVLQLNPSHFSARSENTCQYHTSQVPLLQWNGCGMKLGEKPTRHSFYRYFGLLRLPLKLSKRRLRWLKYANYRLIDTGSQATFWNNGWLSGEDWSVEKEKEFWIKRGISFKEAIDFTYTNLTPSEREQYKPGLRVRLRKHIQEGGDPHNMFMDFSVCKYPKVEQVGGHMQYRPLDGKPFYEFVPNAKTLQVVLLTNPVKVPPIKGLVKHRHLYRGGKWCVICKAPRPFKGEK